MGIEIGCRMTIVRLPSRALVVISPIPLKASDRPLLDSLGTVSHLIAPNVFHHLYFAQAQSLYPKATAWGVEGLSTKCPNLSFDATLNQPGQFEETLDYRPFQGLRTLQPNGIVAVNETVFYHRPSKTLILTDLAFNFDPTFPFTTRLAMQVLGSYDALRPSRLEKWGSLEKAAIAASIRQVLTWEFDRVIPGHGSIVETGGKAQLQAGYEWFLGQRLVTQVQSSE
jgi:hypothetical protein